MKDHKVVLDKTLYHMILHLKSRLIIISKAILVLDVIMKSKNQNMQRIINLNKMMLK